MKLFSAHDINDELLEELFIIANGYRQDEKMDEEKCGRHSWRDVFRDKTLGCIFSEPSIRTRWSFESAMQKFGGKVVSSFGPQSTSAEKGESLIDTLNTASQYVDIIVVRTPEPLGDIDFKWDFDFDEPDAKTHVINAGDGENEHPTQAMLDAYTIWDNLEQLHELNFVVVGDMPCSRTIHSLMALFGTYELNNRFYIWDNREEGLGKWAPDSKTIAINTDEEMVEALRDCDVLYLNRPQHERRSVHEKQCSHDFQLDQKMLNELNGNAIILNPGPRRDEMPDAAIEDPRCKYWEQMKNGLYMRMSILRWILHGQS